MKDSRKGRRVIDKEVKAFGRDKAVIVLYHLASHMSDVSEPLIDQILIAQQLETALHTFIFLPSFYVSSHLRVKSHTEFINHSLYYLSVCFSLLFRLPVSLLSSWLSVLPQRRQSARWTNTIQIFLFFYGSLCKGDEIVARVTCVS